MKKHLIIMWLFVVSVLFICWRDNRKQAVADVKVHQCKEKWWYMCGDFIITHELSLGGGESRTVQFNTREQLWVGFHTDASNDDEAVSSVMSQQPEGYSIILRQTQSNYACSNDIGGGRLFTPVDNRIELVVTNQSACPTTVCIITNSVKYDW